MLQSAGSPATEGIRQNTFSYMRPKGVKYKLNLINKMENVLSAPLHEKTQLQYKENECSPATTIHIMRRIR